MASTLNVRRREPSVDEMERRREEERRIAESGRAFVAASIFHARVRIARQNQLSKEAVVLIRRQQKQRLLRAGAVQQTRPAPF